MDMLDVKVVDDVVHYKVVLCMENIVHILISLDRNIEEWSNMKSNQTKPNQINLGRLEFSTCLVEVSKM